jgi:hypothetical protein
MPNYDRQYAPTIAPRSVFGRVKIGTARRSSSGVEQLSTDDYLKLARLMLPVACRFATEFRLWQAKITHFANSRDALVAIVAELDMRIGSLRHHDPMRFVRNDFRASSDYWLRLMRKASQLFR